MKIELVGVYGDDETIAKSAWVSTSAELTAEKIQRIPQLLKFLAEHEHMTPFEKSFFHFNIKNCDIATHIHLLKHRIGVSINAESARYKVIEHDDGYIPDDWPLEWVESLKKHMAEGQRLYEEATQALTPVLGRQRAKESARYFRGYNSTVNCDIALNWRSFLHMYRLRSAPDAQKEVRDLVNEMLRLIKELPGNPFRYTIEALKL